MCSAQASAKNVEVCTQTDGSMGMCCTDVIKNSRKLFQLTQYFYIIVDILQHSEISQIDLSTFEVHFKTNLLKTEF